MKSSTGTRKLRGSPGSSPHLFETLQALPPNPSSTLLSMSRRPRNLPNGPERASQLPQTERKLPTTREAPSSRTAAIATGTASPTASSVQLQPVVELNDSLSTKTMRNLLQNGPGYRPPLSWSARQAKEKRRKDMLHLQEWIQAS